MLQALLDELLWIIN